GRLALRCNATIAFGPVLCVLLVRFSSIGDIVLTTPLVRALARRHPEAKLVYVTKRAMAPLVADNPHLAEVVALEPDEPLRHLARRLAALAPPPTHGLDLHGSVRSVALRLLVRCRRSGTGARSSSSWAPRASGPWSSAGRKIAASPSSSSPAARRRAPRESSHCRKPGPCWREPRWPSREIPASCTWPPGSGRP